MNTFAPGGDVHRLAPESVEELQRMVAVAATTAEGPEIDLCRARLAMLHGDPDPGAVAGSVAAAKLAALDTWWESDLFSPLEQACLGFTEQFVLSVSGVGQADIDALRAHWPERQVYDFVMALYVWDLSSRAALTLGAVFADDQTRPDRTPGA